MLQTDFGASCVNRKSIFEWLKRFKEGRESVRDDERCRRSKEVKNRFRRKRPALFKLGQWHFHQDNAPGQCTSPQLHPCHTLYLAKMGIKTVHQPPIVQILLPVNFGYSLSSEAVVMRQLRRWKRLWRRSLTRSDKRTSMGPSKVFWNDTPSALQPGEITSEGTRVSCVYYQ